MQCDEPCEPCEELDLELEWRELDALVVVNTARSEVVRDKSTRQAGREKHRVICTLWCGHTHPAGDMKQPTVTCNQSTVPSIEYAVRAVRLKIQENHAGCLAAAQAARAAADGPSSRPPPDALAALMAARRAEQAAARAEMALNAAKARRDLAREMLATAQLEVDALTGAAAEADARLPEAKRQRQRGPPQPWEEAATGWDEQKWRDFEDGEQRRRAVKINDGVDVPDPQRGELGFLHHWRRGLIGAVQSWARGCRK